VKRARLLTTLLAVISDTDTLSHAEVRSMTPEESDARLGRLRVLLAEDNVMNQKVALAWLRRLGITADVAHNGLEVLEAVQRQPYDVILMDCQMPELDGFEATRTLRREEADGTFGNRPPHHVIALTANVMTGDRERCLEAGMDDFLTKPMDVAALESALKRAAGLTENNLSLNTSGNENRNGLDPMMLSPDKGNQPSPTSDPGHSIASLAIDGEFLDLPRVDTEALDSLRFPEEPEFLPDTLNLFLDDAPRRIQELERALESEDMKRARSEAHVLKGNANNLGAMRFGAIAGALEKAVLDGDLTTARAWFRRAQVEWKELQHGLLQVLEESETLPPSPIHP
jgi:CheY-like chemotaxis protein/HPt (histidine-containing phosphotransfer) domain-containing protein